MILGSDFDNTLACCDPLFHLAATRRKLIPEATGTSKSDVRDALRRAGQEPAWTELQGYVYGELIREARPFPGALDLFAQFHQAGIPAIVISHKTEKPFLGTPFDLRASARRWLDDNGFGAKVGLGPDRIFWEPTKDAKLKRIADQGCTDFVDDLPEFLLEPTFPSGVRRFLFDPEARYDEHPSLIRVRSWGELQKRLLSKDPHA